MKFRCILFAAFACTVVSAFAVEEADISPEVTGFLKENCVRCHGPEKQKGSQRFDTMPLVVGDAAIAQRWQDVLDVLNLSEMPPEDEKQPPKEDLANMLETLTGDLAKVRKRLVDSGGDIVIRRLNRREYARTIDHLFGVPVETDFLPDDAKIDGFDTLGQAQSFSSLHLERYLDLGARVLDRAMPAKGWKSKLVTKHSESEGERKNIEKHREKLDKNAKGFEEKAKSGKEEAILRRMISLRELELLEDYMGRSETANGALIPFDGVNPAVAVTIGGGGVGAYKVSVRCGANADKPDDELYLKVVRGAYRASVPDAVDYYQVRGTIKEPQVIEFTVVQDDGIRSNRLSFERRNSRLEKRESMKESRTYYHQFPMTVYLMDDERTDLWIDCIDVEGPLPSPEPPLRETRLFAGLDAKKLSEKEARELVVRFAFEAFWHQTPEAEFIDRVMKVYAEARSHGADSKAALKDALRVVMASPRFLFLCEPRPEGTPPRALDDRELAVRLSYFLWSAPPDEELYGAAEAGILTDPDVLKKQVERMIASPRSRSFIETFLTGWLELDRLDNIKPDAASSPRYDDAVQRSSREEVFAFFETLLREDLPAHHLIESDFAVVNSILADFYGFRGVSGDHFRKVKLPADSLRGGLLGQSAVLTLTGTGDRTSPVERGVYVLRKLLDRPPPPAPANVPMLDEESVGTRSIRETLDLHMSKAQCQSCHRRIDPLGFGMENFDPVGLWRDKVASVDGTRSFPIETAGLMPDGKRAFADFQEMKAHVSADRDAMLRGLTESLMTYALGRTIGFTDDDLIEKIVARTAAEGYGLKSLLHKIIQSSAFLTK